MGRTPHPWRRGDRGAWYAWVDGQRRKIAPGEATEKEATRLLYEQMGREPGGPGAGLTVRDVFDLFLADRLAMVERGDLERVTVDGYLRHLDSAADAFGGVEVSRLRPHYVEAWAGANGWGPTTRNNAIAAVKAAFRRCKRLGHIDINPVADMEKPTARRRESIPAEGAVAAWGEAWSDRAGKDLLTALAETGCRPGEVARLTAADVDLEAGTWAVSNKTRRKTGRAKRTIYLTEAMVELSRRLVAERPHGPLFLNRNGRPWTRNAMACRFRRLRQRGVAAKEDTAYSVRHLYATDALERTGDVAAVAELMGHSDPKMLMSVYSKLSERREHLRRVASRVRPSPPDTPPIPAAPEDGPGTGPAAPPALPAPPGPSRGKRQGPPR